MPSVLCMPAGLPDIVAVFIERPCDVALRTTARLRRAEHFRIHQGEGLLSFISLNTLMDSYILAGSGLIASGLSSPVGVSTTVAAPFPHWPSST